MAYDPDFDFYSELNGREIFMYGGQRCFIKERKNMHVIIVREDGMEFAATDDELQTPDEEDMSDF